MRVELVHCHDVSVELKLTADANAHSAAQDDGEKDRGRRTGEDLVRKRQGR